CHVTAQPSAPARQSVNRPEPQLDDSSRNADANPARRSVASVRASLASGTPLSVAATVRPAAATNAPYSSTPSSSCSRSPAMAESNAGLSAAGAEARARSTDSIRDARARNAEAVSAAVDRVCSTVKGGTGAEVVDSWSSNSAKDDSLRANRSMGSRAADPGRGSVDGLRAGGTDILLS